VALPKHGSSRKAPRHRCTTAVLLNYWRGNRPPCEDVNG